MKDKSLKVRPNTLHMALIRIMSEHRKKANRQFEEVGITHAQPKILDFLTQKDGCIQRELAVSCHIEPASVTSVLSTMEKAGLITRVQNPNDRRVLNVFLTDKGREAQGEVGRIFGNLDKESLEGFSEEEVDHLLGYLDRIYDNMRREERGND